VMGKSEQETMTLCRSLGSLFPTDAGRIRPFHRSLVEWLTYVDRGGQYFVSANKGHKRLAEYGMGEYAHGTRALSQYMLAYLPVHLVKAECWEDLKTVLSDLTFIDMATGIPIKSLSGVWDALEAHSSSRMVDAYRPMIVSPGAYGQQTVFRVMSLFQERKHAREALELLRYLVSHDIDPGEIPVDLISLKGLLRQQV
jgi:hypothetical protein